ncbi:MAG: hypothetical protein ACYTAS_13950 [Planctomycetota bacterium]|jgi:hypothetical protein
MTTIQLGIADSETRTGCPALWLAICSPAALSVHPIVQNKANLRRFWPENADPTRKQTQTNPIGEAILSEGPACRTAVERTSQTSRAWHESRGQNAKQSQFPPLLAQECRSGEKTKPIKANLGRLYALPAPG